MKRAIIFFFAIALLSCRKPAETEKPFWVCNCEQQRAASEWVTKNMDAANNRSDEEMEDVIEQLQQTAVKLHCKFKNVVVITEGDKIVSVPSDSCLIIFQDYR